MPEFPQGYWGHLIRMRELEVINSGRVTELDGLRGIAVLMVLVWHFVGAMINTNLGWWASAASKIFIFGRTGVDLFFVLSGFLITRIILSRTLSGRRFLQSFYIKRALRICPPYFLLVGIFWTVVIWGVNSPEFNSNTPLWRHLTFTQNFWMSEMASWGPAAISVTWSVAIEEHYYLFFPFIALVFPPRLLPNGLLLVALASILSRGLFYNYSPENAYTPYVMTLCRLDGLAAGGLVAWAFQDEAARNRLIASEAKLRQVMKWLIAVVALLLLSMAANLPATMSYWGHTYLTVLFALGITLVLLNTGDLSTKWLRSRFVTFFGRISYSVYLFHPLILSICFLLAQRPERIDRWADALIAAFAFISTILTCTALFRWFERPILLYGRKWTY